MPVRVKFLILIMFRERWFPAPPPFLEDHQCDPSKNEAHDEADNIAKGLNGFVLERAVPAVLFLLTPLGFDSKVTFSLVVWEFVTEVSTSEILQSSRACRVWMSLIPFFFFIFLSKNNRNQRFSSVLEVSVWVHVV